MDIIEDGHERKSTLIASQIPAKGLYDAIVDKTMADAVMDRIVYQVVRIELYGSLSEKCKLKRIKKLARRKIMFIFAKKNNYYLKFPTLKTLAFLISLCLSFPHIH